MTLVKSNPGYIEPAKVGVPTRPGIRVISEMSTTRILGYIAMRHRVGLLSLSTFVLSAYIVWDKAVKLFI